jgi:hypothetical protein
MPACDAIWNEIIYSVVITEQWVATAVDIPAIYLGKLVSDVRRYLEQQVRPASRYGPMACKLPI